MVSWQARKVLTASQLLGKGSSGAPSTLKLRGGEGNDMTDSRSRDVSRTRTVIALVVIGTGTLGIVLISWVALAHATSKDETSRLIFSSVLPLIGTWVGAVLAFYFSRDNLQAGSETALSAVRAAGGLDSETLVAAVMTTVGRIRPRREVADEAEALALALSELYNLMKSAGQSRVPILAHTQVALFVVHEPDIEKYAAEAGAQVANLAIGDTLGKLLDKRLSPEVTDFAAVGPTATLAEARTALARVPNAKDVFVTGDGQKTGKVRGWLTNSDLARAT
jgi:hypothetical protein